MLVKNWMNEKIVTVDAHRIISDAINLLKNSECALLVVTENGKQIGIVTERDIKRATTSDVATLDVFELRDIISRVTVKAIIAKDPIMIPMDYTVEEAAEIFLREDISSAPVVDADGRIIGEITQMDVFKLLISLTGIGMRGIQFAFLVDDRPGAIRDITGIIRAYGGRMMSILTSYQHVKEGFRKVYIRMHAIDRAKLKDLISDLQKQTTLLYMIDHREKKRVLFS